MKKFLLGVIIGFAIKFFGIEAANILSEIRWNNCQKKVETGELPSVKFYCLNTVFTKDAPWYERMFVYQLDLYERFTKK